MLTRIARDTAITCGLFSVVAIVMWPRDWRVASGVMGGGALMGLSFWAIRGTVDTWLGRAVVPGASRARLGLVKFFTRYVMLAFAAYVMMARLHLDPVAMLAGVSALGVAVGVEAVREFRASHDLRRG